MPLLQPRNVCNKVIHACGHAVPYDCKELPKTLKASVGTVKVWISDHVGEITIYPLSILDMVLLIGNFDLDASENRII